MIGSNTPMEVSAMDTVKINGKEYMAVSKVSRALDIPRKYRTLGENSSRAYQEQKRSDIFKSYCKC